MLRPTGRRDGNDNFPIKEFALKCLVDLILNSETNNEPREVTALGIRHTYNKGRNVRSELLRVTVTWLASQLHTMYI